MPLSKLSNLVSSATDATTDDEGGSTTSATDSSFGLGDSNGGRALDPAGPARAVASPAPSASSAAASGSSTPVSPAPRSKSSRGRLSSLAKGKLRIKKKPSLGRHGSGIHWCDQPGVSTNGTASSCQLFSMFKAMATDKSIDGDETGDGTTSPVSIDTDSELLSSGGESDDDDDGGDRAQRARIVGDSPSFATDDTTTKAAKSAHHEYTANHRAAGDRFAAASLHSFSPLGGMHGRHTRPRDHKLEINTSALDALQDDEVFEPDSPLSATNATDESTLPSSPGTSGQDEDATKPPVGTAPKVPDMLQDSARFRHDDVPAAEKVATIIGEFGDIAATMVNMDGTPGEPERLLAESQGTLFKGVMMLGNLHLTNYRLLFHALMPPDSVFVSGPAEPDQTEEAANARFARPDIIKSGNVTVHRESLMKPKRKVWMELSPEMLTTYPSGDEAGRVRPLYSILLSHAIRLAPYDPKHSLEFFLTYDSSHGERTLHFSVDNEQSANQWRRLFEGALFRQARQKFRAAHRMGPLGDGLSESQALQDDDRWSMIRCSVPLDRVQVEGTADYHSFAILVKLAIQLDKYQHMSWHPEKIAEGNYDVDRYHIKGYDKHPDDRKGHDRHGDDKKGEESKEDDKHADDGIHRFPSIPLPHTRARSATETNKRSSLLPPLPKLRLRSGSRGSQDSSRDRSQGSRESSRDRRGSTASRRHSNDCEPVHPQWTNMDRTESAPSRSGTPSSDSAFIDSKLGVAFDRECFQAHAIRKDETEWGEENTFFLLLALMNEDGQFASKLREAVIDAHTRVLKEGATAMRVRLDVGGYDCLATDDDIDQGRDISADTVSIPSVDMDDEDEDTGKPRAAIETRKAEKAAMAARVFGLRESEGIWLKRCYIDGIVPARGHIILTPRYLCFWRRANVGSDIKYRFEAQDIRGVEKHQPLRVGMHGLAVHIHGHRDLLFDFWKADSRNEVLQRIVDFIEYQNKLAPDGEDDDVADDGEGAPLAPVTSPGPHSMLSVSETIPLGWRQDQKPTDDSSQGEGRTEPPLVVWDNARQSRVIDAPLDMNPKVMKVAGESIQHAAEILAPPPDMLMYPQAMADEALSYMPFVANRPWFSRTGWNVRLTPRRFTMLTIGSRGDVQPYIALALRLMEDGHQCVIVTHAEFKKWIEGYGIEHRQAGGDPTALMKLSTEHAMFSPGFFKEALGGFRKWLDELLVDSWKACHDADVLIESPSAMAGIHIAEALGIPYFRAFTMPWTRTTAYPQAFMVPMFEMGPSFNYSTYVLFDNIIWRASSGQINRWRKKYLHLPATDQSTLSVSKVPFLYNFSPAVVPKPLDWNDDITITGYWNLDNSDMDWTPPDSLIEFMDRAKAQDKPIVYIGFGSIVVPDPVGMTKSIVKGVEKAGVCAIIAKGWSARGEDAGKKQDAEPIDFSDSCYAVDKVPHSWLFPKINAALHHGGAGTTGASLRAGLPTLIKPWFGDQYFWALRVTKLGVGLKLGGLRSNDIAAALKKATSDRIMIEKAARIGERIASESGVDTALNVINESILRAARTRTEQKKDEHANCNENPLHKALTGLPLIGGSSANETTE